MLKWTAVATVCCGVLYWGTKDSHWHSLGLPPASEHWITKKIETKLLLLQDNLIKYNRQRQQRQREKDREKIAHLGHLDILFEEIREAILHHQQQYEGQEGEVEESDEARVEDGDCCFHCGEILGASTEEGGKVIFALGHKWHPRHFKCSFCLCPIESDQFLSNCWNQVYCLDHDIDSQKCFSCERIIPPIGTAFKLYEDGRQVCQFCLETAVYDEETLSNLWKIIVNDIFDLPSDLADIKLEFADLETMKNEHKREKDWREGKELSKEEEEDEEGESIGVECLPHLLGVTKSVEVGSKRSSYSVRMDPLFPGNGSKKGAIDRVMVLRGLPVLLTTVVLAHELGHCLVSREGIKLGKKEEEGLCEFFAYIWIYKMKELNENKADVKSNEILTLITSFTPEDVDFHLRRIEGNTSSIYGKGFQGVLAMVQQGWSFRNAMEYALENNRLPAFAFGNNLQVELHVSKWKVNSPSHLKIIDTLATSMNDLKLTISHFQEHLERGQKALTEIIWPNPEHKQLILRYKHTEKILFFNPQISLFADLVQEIMERLNLPFGEVISITCNGIPLMCDEDICHLTNDAVLYVQEMI